MKFLILRKKKLAKRMLMKWRLNSQTKCNAGMLRFFKIKWSPTPEDGFEREIDAMHKTPHCEEILIVDPDDDLRDVLRRLFECEGYFAVGARTMAEGKAMLARRLPDLILVDVNLPDGNGFDLVRDIGRHSPVPTIIYTACGSDADVIVGLNHGADDYIVKSCGSAELLARIQAILRRSGSGRGPAGNSASDVTEMAHFAGFTLDCSRHVLTRGGGWSVRLTRTVFSLLMMFLKTPHEPLSRNQILAAIWPDDEDVSKHAINTEVCRLRRKLGTGDGSPSLISTVRGQGYVFGSDVIWSEAHTPQEDVSSITSRKTERGRVRAAIRAITENGL